MRPCNEGECSTTVYQVINHRGEVVLEEEVKVSADGKTVLSERVPNRNKLNTGAKLREALKRCVNMLDVCLLYSREGYPAQNDDIREVMAQAESALALPLRNCDVGTAEEQGIRFKKFCNDHQEPWHGCTNYCPVLMSEKCALAWAQMPYEEGGAE